MDDKVISFTGITTATESAESVLEKAKEWNMAHCVIVGQTEDGKFQFGGSTSSGVDILWLLQKGIWELERMDEGN